MIPKVIHYCWFGRNPLSPLAVKCMNSWRKCCPDFEIIEWNETNFDVTQNRYMKEAYEAKKWAFVSDYARLWILVNHGGIYCDTDCEILKPLDRFLDNEAFSGFECSQSPNIPTGVIGACKNHPLFWELLKRYDHRHFIKSDGSFDLTTNVTEITEVCLGHGLVLNNEKQTVAGCTFFPAEYFCPKNSFTGSMDALTENTYMIHHFEGSWKKPVSIREWRTLFFKMPERILRRWIVKPAKRLLNRN